MAERSIKFYVTDGVRRSGTWKCWTPGSEGKSDFYLLCREVGRALKVSFHGSGSWHYGWITHYLEGAAPPEDWPARYVEIWQRPAPVHGTPLTLAFRIVTLSSAVITPVLPSGGDWVQVPAPDPPNEAIETLVYICASGVRVGAQPTGCTLVGSFALENDEAVYLSYRRIATPAFQPLPAQGLRSFHGLTLDKINDSDTRALMFKGEPDGSRTLVECKLAYRPPDGVDDE